MTQLTLSLDRYWLVSGPQHPRGQPGALELGRLVLASCAEEARAIEEQDGGTVTSVVPAPDSHDVQAWNEIAHLAIKRTDPSITPCTPCVSSTH